MFPENGRGEVVRQEGMSSRYATAFEQIREILESRTQAMPILTCKHLSDELTCWPIPPLRTIRRFMEQVRNEVNDHGGQAVQRVA
jgi:hypothetical protein